MKNFSIDVSFNTFLPQDQRDRLNYEIIKKVTEIVGDDYNGTCFVYSEKEGLLEYKKELSEYFAWFDKIKAEYGITYKHEILTKADINIWNKWKDWNKKLEEISTLLRLTKADKEEIFKQLSV